MNQKFNNIEFLIQKVFVKMRKMVEKDELLLSSHHIRDIVSSLPLLTQEIDYSYDNEKSFFNFKSLLSDLTTHLFIPLSVAIVFIILLLNFVSIGSPKQIEVTFQLISPQAKVVQIVGDFTKWEPVSLARKNGVWQVTLKLKPGKYKYIYIVDGNPYIDPTTDVYEDPFGTKNSVIYI